MTTPIGFDNLKDILPRRIDALPAHRQPGPHTRSRLQDAALGAFGLFFTPAPSFLEAQRHLQHTPGHHDACTLFGVAPRPCHTQIRNLLDPLRPRHRDGGYLAVFEGLEQYGSFSSLRGLAEPLLLALDGPQDFSSHPRHCHNCRRRRPAKGPPLSYQRAIPPVIGWPGRAEVLALPPEGIRPPDGPDKQDGERVAGKRWIDKHATHVAPDGGPWLGDELYRHHPLGKCALPTGVPCLFVCKPDAHATLYERLALWPATDAINALETRRKHGRITELTRYRYMHEVFRRGGPGALAVTWLEITSGHAKTGAPLSPHRCITPQRLRADNVAQGAPAGRGGWKVANENNNVLTTQGEQLAHNFGHGKRDLAALLLRRNLLALLFHTVLLWGDATEALLRQGLGRRQTFFEDMRALTRYMVFESWPHLMDCMLRGLQLESKRDPG